MHEQDVLPKAPVIPVSAMRPAIDRARDRVPQIIAALLDLHFYWGSVANLRDNEPESFDPVEGWDCLDDVLHDVWDVIEFACPDSADLVAQVRTSPIRGRMAEDAS